MGEDSMDPAIAHLSSTRGGKVAVGAKCGQFRGGLGHLGEELGEWISAAATHALSYPIPLSHDPDISLCLFRLTPAK